MSVTTHSLCTNSRLLALLLALATVIASSSPQLAAQTVLVAPTADSLVGAVAPLVPDSAAAPARPEAPTLLWAAPLGPERVRLTWQDNTTDGDHHILEIKELGPGPFLELPFVLNGPLRIVDLVGLNARTSYLFRIRAANRSGVSAPTNVAAAETWSADADCESGPNRLCLLGGRFAVDVVFRNFRDDDREGIATAVPLTDESGLFWFFTPDNIELIIDLGGVGKWTKGLVGERLITMDSVFKEISLNRIGLSDLAYWIYLTDTVTGETRVHHNLQGRQCNVSTLQIPDTSTDYAQDFCSRDERNLCFHEDRFELRLDWLHRGGRVEAAKGMTGTTSTGFFLYAADSPAGFSVKLLDGRNQNGNFWLYAGSRMPHAGRLKIVDSYTGAEYILNHEAASCGAP